MPRWRFDLKSLFIYVTCMAIASAIARVNWVAGGVFAFWLTFALARMTHSLQVLRRHGDGDTWSELFFCLVASLSAVFLATFYWLQRFTFWSWTALPILAIVLSFGGSAMEWLYIALAPAFGYAVYAAGSLYIESWLREPPSNKQVTPLNKNQDFRECSVDRVVI